MSSETLQPGMMTSQPGMMTSQPGMMTSQPGMMTSQPGMMTSQPGMMTSQPGMMGSQLGMMNQPMNQPMSTQLAIYNPHQRLPFMGQQFGQPGQVWPLSFPSSCCSPHPPPPPPSPSPPLPSAIPAGRPAHAAARDDGGRGIHADPRGSLPDDPQHVPAATSSSSPPATAATAATAIGSGDCHVTTGCAAVTTLPPTGLCQHYVAIRDQAPDHRGEDRAGQAERQGGRPPLQGKCQAVCGSICIVISGVPVIR